ncbi:952_t:CDS:2, partial [Gigaspora rosea]
MPRANCYIVVATDYMPKWPENKAIPFANAQEVSYFLFSDIICRYGCPKKYCQTGSDDTGILDSETIILRTMNLIKNLPQVCNEVVVYVQQAQAKIKEWYDKKLQPNPTLDI